MEIKVIACAMGVLLGVFAIVIAVKFRNSLASIVLAVLGATAMFIGA